MSEKEITNDSDVEQNHDARTTSPALVSRHPRGYWRSLEELAENSEFEEILRREFPRAALAHQATAWINPISRRKFLKLMGASLALAGLNACAQPPNNKIVPYVHQPENIVPGKPLYFATAFALGGYATGVLVESHEGRPTKIEGNPNHPASLGATDAFAQASVLTLYDPDRSQAVLQHGAQATWDDFVIALRAVVGAQRGKQGVGLRILTETVTSPTLANQLKALLQTFPSAKWHQYEPLGRDNVRGGAQLAFGQYVETRYDFSKADVILALDADFLACVPGNLRYTRDFTARRRVENQQPAQNRLYAVESAPSLTGAAADHRLPVRASEVQGFAGTIAAGVGIAGVTVNPQNALRTRLVDALIRDLQAHRGSSLVIAGDAQAPVVHALAHAMNQILGNVGSTVIYTDPVEANPVDQLASLRELVQDMDAGRVELLVMLGGNPVYNTPVDLAFGDALKKVGLKIHLSLYDDETSARCDWHIPEADYLESWSDTRAFDGTVTIVQPLIAPLYGGKSAHELLDAFTDKAPRSDHDIVRANWQGQIVSDFESFWRTSLHDGFVANTARQPKQFSVNAEAIRAGVNGSASSLQTGQSLEIIFRPDPNIYDGRFANNGWLQELPKALTKLTWDNVALLSPATAQRLGVSYDLGLTGGEHGDIVADVVELRYQGRTLRAPVWILPGHADDSVTVYLGYGRIRAGKVGNGAGFNGYALRTSNAPWFDSGLEIRKTGEKFSLADTQFHQVTDGRDLVRTATLADFLKNPNFAHDEPPNESLYPPVQYPGYAWGMAIDLNACIGCNACVVACQAENNIPIVGKEEVLRGREMHWLRIDRYYQGDATNPETFHQPVPCMHCENAPCEPVCPVGATTHSGEGLNEMSYNRCVGTRYCSNNCPYKVRRFNFFQYADYETKILKLLNNPDVTVRSRGVMEKCTYCVQRITHARIDAEKEGRAIRDGEIVTACQAACPAEAIVFGNINDPNSRVAKLKASSLNYALLAGLNTRPRTTYLAAVRNPNPELG